VTVTVTQRGSLLRSELAHIPPTIAAGTGLPDHQAATALIHTLHRLTETMHAVSNQLTVDNTETKADTRR